MLITSSVHCHTTYCDGVNTAEEMVTAAIVKGLKTIGFSGHSYLSFGQDYTMSCEDTAQYFTQINSLKAKYKGKIDILCGIEMDYYSPNLPYIFDYSIGSVHSIFSLQSGKFYSVDNTADELRECIEKGFGGRGFCAVEEYYKAVVANAKKNRPTIIGHFDLIRKLNQGNTFFCEDSEEYCAIALNALDEILKLDIPFEVNTGGIYRGYRKNVYPNNFLLNRICQSGGKVIVTADAHNIDGLTFMFDETSKMLADIGFNKIYQLTASGIAAVEL